MKKDLSGEQVLSIYRKKKLLLVVLSALLLLSVCAVILGSVFRNRSRAPDQEIVVTCGNFALSNTELSYYYWSEYFYLINSMGTYLDGILDPSVPLDRQMYDQTRTWEQYLLERALITVKDTMSMVFAAQEEGFAMPPEQEQAYAQVLKNFADYALQFGFVKADGSADVQAYLQDSYGVSAREESFEEYLYHSYFAAAYADHLYASIELSEQQIEQHLQLHEADYAESTDPQADAKADLQNETYQNLYLQIVDRYVFGVNEENIVLMQPNGLFDTEK